MPQRVGIAAVWFDYPESTELERDLIRLDGVPFL
jgi:hypothetical protein